MDRRKFIVKSVLTGAIFVSSPAKNIISAEQPLKKIFLTSADFDAPWIKYLIKLTEKERPKICLLPTASGDNQQDIDYWLSVFKPLDVEFFVQKVFIDSVSQAAPFEELLLKMDAIFVPGGNTLNMLALWKAQGIDKVLHKAWNKGIVLSGTSAGAVCWFQQALVDSRPQRLTVADGLGFLRGSCCVHYHDNALRKKIFHQMILKNQISAGYALDNNTGLYFQNDTLHQVVVSDNGGKVYRLFKHSNIVTEYEINTNLAKIK